MNTAQRLLCLQKLESLVYMNNISSKNTTDFKSMISYFKNLLSGLVCCMNHDLIHGDLKPENVVWVNNSVRWKRSFQIYRFWFEYAVF